MIVESQDVTPNGSSASSYDVNPGTGTISLISGAVVNGQTDSCWIVITRDGRYAYIANFGSGTISSYVVGANGNLALMNGAAASTGEKSQPVDLHFSADNQYLYLLQRGGGAVSSFRIESDGASAAWVRGGLTPEAGNSGLAAY